jgi:ABC-type branched-subunit amino acid transport system ATPase component
MEHNILEIKELTKKFDGVVAVDRLSFAIKQGEIVCITGENGAGKTTLFNLITGFEKPDNGSIIFNNQEITNLQATRRAQKGIARLFQNPRIFNHLTVVENLLAAASNHNGDKITNYLKFRFKKIIKTETHNKQVAIDLLKFMQLENQKNYFAANLSFGEKKLLGMAMLLLNNASVLLLDEIYSGVNKRMIEKINQQIVQLSKQGKTFLIIEHRIKEIQEICNRTIVLEQGHIKQSENSEKTYKISLSNTDKKYSDENKVLKAENIEVAYGTNTILQNINFELSQGEILGIIGQNGTGKSTLLKSIASIVPKKQGNIFYKDNNLNKLRTDKIQKAGIAYGLQEGLVFNHLKVIEHLQLIEKNEKQWETAFEYFPEIRNILKKRAGNLSGGQRQMLSLSMLLLQKTDLWLLDEPTGGLSNENRIITFDFLQKMKQERQKSFIIVEHNYDFIFNLADKIMLIKNNTNTEKYEPDYIKNNLETILYS